MAANQLGWMYQFGQGVKSNDSMALTWYDLAANQGNTQGQNNFQALVDDAQSTALVSDPALEPARRWAKIRELHAGIDKAEAQALGEDDYADEFEHFGKGKKDALAKVMDTLGTVPAARHRVEAAKYRAEAAHLRDQLVQIESQNQVSAGIPAQ